MFNKNLRNFFAKKISPRTILSLVLTLVIIFVTGTILPVRYNGTWASPLKQIIQKEQEKKEEQQRQQQAAQEAAKKAQQESQDNSSDSDSSPDSDDEDTNPSAIVAFYADSQSDSDEEDAAHQATVDAIIASGANPVFHAGDFLEDGTEASWNRFNAVTATLRSIRSFYATLGNNDRVEGDSSTPNPHYFNDLGLSDHYSINTGNLHLIVLDSAFNSAGSQAGYLATELQNNQDKITGVMFHHPSFSSSIASILEANGADFVVSGHVHSYSHSVSGGVNYFTLGQPSSGFLKMYIYSNRVIYAGMGSGSFNAR